MTQTTDADGRVITYSYDSRGDQTGESWLNSSGSAIYIATYTYDSAQEMTGAADSNSLLTIAYDNDGRVGTIVTSGPGSGQPTVTLTYGYDPDGDVTSIKDSLSGSGYSGPGITTYMYDPALRLTTITQSFGGTTGPEIVYTYDPGGRVTETERSIGGSGTAVVTTYGYDAANNNLAVNNFTQSLALNNQTPHNIDESFDPAARVGTLTITNGANNTTTTYSYDPSGQVTGATGGSNDSYSYDLNGNPDSTGYTTGAGNELTNSPGVTYTYDNNGNIITATTSSGTTTYTYDYENRITSVEQNGTFVATYTYDALGRRIGIKDSGTQTWTVYDGTGADANPYADFTASGAVSVRYLFGPAAVSNSILATANSSGTTYWYLTDQLGSVRYVDSTSGTVLDAITYDAFGNITSQTDSSYAGRFMFAGMQDDTTVGIYYDHARYYDAAIGRFMSQDPEGFAAGDANLYRYVGNAVTEETDPSGLIVVPPETTAIGLFGPGGMTPPKVWFPDPPDHAPQFPVSRPPQYPGRGWWIPVWDPGSGWIWIYGGPRPDNTPRPGPVLPDQPPDLLPPPLPPPPGPR